MATVLAIIAVELHSPPCWLEFVGGICSQTLLLVLAVRSYRLWFRINVARARVQQHRANKIFMKAQAHMLSSIRSVDTIVPLVTASTSSACDLHTDDEHDDDDEDDDEQPSVLAVRVPTLSIAIHDTRLENDKREQPSASPVGVPTLSIAIHDTSLDEGKREQPPASPVGVPRLSIAVHDTDFDEEKREHSSASSVGVPTRSAPVTPPSKRAHVIHVSTLPEGQCNDKPVTVNSAAPTPGKYRVQPNRPSISSQFQLDSKDEILETEDLQQMSSFKSSRFLRHPRLGRTSFLLKLTAVVGILSIALKVAMLVVVGECQRLSDAASPQSIITQAEFALSIITMVVLTWQVRKFKGE